MPTPTAAAAALPNNHTIWSLTGAAFGAAMLLDITADALGGAQVSHMAIELVLMAAVLGGGTWVGRRWQRYQADIEVSLQAASASASRWERTAGQLSQESHALRQETAALKQQTETLQAEAVILREAAERAAERQSGLSAVIDAQFRRWSLSPAESEVAMLLLKGLSLKETAEVRSTSERTTRKQARAVYRKSGLAGRAELSAWFLEDLLVTCEASDTSLTE